MCENASNNELLVCDEGEINVWYGCHCVLWYGDEYVIYVWRMLYMLITFFL